VALLAKNYDSRVQAAYGMGVSNVYSTYNLSSCVSNGNRTLQSDRLRAVDGEKDVFAGGSQSAVQSSLQNVTGDTCKSGSYSCLSGNNSGWLIVKNSQVQDGSADHCYMRASGGCLGSQNSLDAGWKSGTKQLGDGSQPGVADQFHHEVRICVASPVSMRATLTTAKRQQSAQDWLTSQD